MTPSPLLLSHCGGLKGEPPLPASSAINEVPPVKVTDLMTMGGGGGGGGGAAGGGAAKKAEARVTVAGADVTPFKTATYWKVIGALL